ncbi:MAG TPA: hypothetical protein PLG15_01280 [Candidatus Gastranaerophilaceae bacterium]|nr:hypothetical protein [Candidatus Gastranaerophilaceae bacterium]HPT41000.1 hypothetical protein [Candidatus Gastranaerophilaceae bacterium]
MISVSKIMNTTVNYGLKKPLKTLAKMNLIKKVTKEYRGNNIKFIAGLGIFSIILKDGLGCYLYVKQSLANKKIPEDKRKFVAALDLTNGGLMISSQILAFLTVSNEKVQEKLFGKLFGKTFDNLAKKFYVKINAVKNDTTKMTLQEFEECFKKFKGGTKNIFAFLTSLVAATILAKRVIVPFIATPLADKAKVWMDKKDSKTDKVDK